MAGTNDLLAETSLLNRFENVEEVLPDTVVTTQRGDRFHRQALDEEETSPACNVSLSGALHASLDDAVTAGKLPCRTCFEAALEYLATQDDSDVELRNGRDDASIAVDGGTLDVSDDPDRELKLTSLPEEVMVKGGKSKVMHAPTPSGTLCGLRGGYRTVDQAAVKSHYRPCENCFHLPDSDE